MIFKKGEMTTQQIVILIILIASFAVLLFFLFRLNLGDETDKQLCYNSVMNRANKLVPTESVPLNCKRSYVCLSKDGSCENFLDPIVKKVKTEEEVYEVLANELSDCWWMFGEGKVNYIGKDMFPDLYCSLCSQIAFDDSVKEIFSQGGFPKRSVYNYMCSHKLDSSGGPTYCEYLYGTNDLSIISGGKDFGIIRLDNQYYSLMGIVSEVNEFGWAGIGAGLAIVAVATGGLGVPFYIAAVGGAAGGYFLAPIAEGFSGQTFLRPSLIEAGNSPEFNSLGCKEITTLS